MFATLKSFLTSDPIPARRPTRLGVQGLEAREVPAGISVIDNVLVIDGHVGVENVATVTQVPGGGNMKAQLRNANGIGYLTKTYNTILFRSIRFEGKGLKDTFTSEVRKDSVMNGGAGDDVLTAKFNRNVLSGGDGNDRLNGGGHDDELWGNDGNDSMYGGYGSDKLYGQRGSDYMHGGYGFDVLWGGNDGDQMYGDGNDDQMYGEMGFDFLRGGDGKDMLFGGVEDVYRITGPGSAGVMEPGRDNMSGGPGLDRLMLESTDAVFEREGTDAHVLFMNTTGPTSHTTSGISGLLTYGAGKWSNYEAGMVIGGLETVFRLTNNNAFLKAGGRDLSFTREGFYVPRNATDGLNDAADTKANDFGSGILAWNSGGGAMSLTGLGLAYGPDSVKETVFHEIAHNWDDESGTVFTNFKALSGWRRSTTPGPGETLSGDGQWVYRTGSEFARTYGRWNPHEDWTTMWEAYHQRKLGTLSAADATRLAAKLTLITAFIDSKR